MIGASQEIFRGAGSKRRDRRQGEPPHIIMTVLSSPKGVSAMREPPEAT